MFWLNERERAIVLLYANRVTRDNGSVSPLTVRGLCFCLFILSCFPALLMIPDINIRTERVDSLIHSKSFHGV